MAVANTDNINTNLISSLNSGAHKAMGVLNEKGKIAINSLYPDEIEYYLCALEVVDALDNNEVIDFITFPIMPDSIRLSDQKIQSTTKTSAGIVVLENFSFTPKTINLSGNFGKKFKTLNGQVGFTLPASLKDTVTRTFNSKSPDLVDPIFDPNFKTGYGMTKILERIFNKSSSLNDHLPVMVFFYCYAFNYNFLVQLNNIQFSQNKSLNMIWEYNMTMTAIAPAEAIRSGDDYKNALSKFTKESFVKSRTNAILSFVSDEKTLRSNQLENVIGNALGGTSNEKFIQGKL